jgi:hypothetical protein
LSQMNSRLFIAVMAFHGIKKVEIDKLVDALRKDNADDAPSRKKTKG